jgi:hypothetical protein
MLPRELKIEVNILPENQFSILFVEAQSQLHKFSEPVVKDYTYAKSQFLSS